MNKINLIDVCKIQYGYAFDSKKFSIDTGIVHNGLMKDLRSRPLQTMAASWRSLRISRSGLELRVLLIKSMQTQLQHKLTEPPQN